MITVTGPTTNAGTVPPGANLWKYIAGAAGNIELNTGAAVTGIDAPNPADTNIHLQLNTNADFGVPVGAFFVEDNANLYLLLAGMVPDSPAYAPALIVEKPTTNESWKIIVNEKNGIVSCRMRYVNNGDFIEIEVNENGVTIDFDNTILFRIDSTGAIWTNQSEAAAGVDTTIVSRQPYYDNTGALVGYIPIMTNP